MFIFEREGAQAGERQREGDRGYEGALCRQQQAQCGAQTHKLQDHHLSLNWMLNPLSHPRAPKQYNLKQQWLKDKSTREIRQQR